MRGQRYRLRQDLKPTNRQIDDLALMKLRALHPLMAGSQCVNTGVLQLIFPSALLQDLVQSSWRSVHTISSDQQQQQHPHHHHQQQQNQQQVLLSQTQCQRQSTLFSQRQSKLLNLALPQVSPERQQYMSSLQPVRSTNQNTQHLRDAASSSQQSSNVHAEESNNDGLDNDSGPEHGQLEDKEGAESDIELTPTRQLFTIRPSVLSPLYPLNRERCATEERLELLRQTLHAHIELATELHSLELQAHDDSEDPVAEALAARRASMHAVLQSYQQLKHHHLMPQEVSQSDISSYYALMERMLRARDPGMQEFHDVQQGKVDIWSYWFNGFKTQYAGLPGLGSLEDIYNSNDEQDIKQQLSTLQQLSQKLPATPKVDKRGRAVAKGGRKTSVAQVYLWKGQGRIVVNRKPLDAYFSDLLMRSHVLKPLIHTNLVERMDVLIHVQGGGVSGQAQAAAHGIARALVRFDPDLKQSLRSARLLRRDPRSVERKKYGRAKARRAFSWVKR